MGGIDIEAGLLRVFVEHAVRRRANVDAYDDLAPLLDRLKRTGASDAANEKAPSANIATFLLNMVISKK